MFLSQFPFRRARARAPRFSFLKLTPGVIMLAGNTVVLCAGSSRLPGLMRF